ncbi:hypothetical protein PO909_011137 [Leuciscus waleckii]
MRSRYEYNIMYVFFSLLSAWTVFLNLLVIISISHFKKLHTPTNLIILSLAVADLLIGLIVIPVDATRLIETCWYFGDTFCKLFIIILGLLSSASFTNLVLIAVDRYVAVCHPLLYPQKITTTKTIGFACIVTDLFMSFIFPCTLIITLYLRIFYVVHQQVKVINSLMKGGKSESKAALTLGIIVIVYMLCFVPYFICSISVNSSTTITVLAWVVYTNSGLNPLIYALFYPWFKKTVKHILTLKIFQPASSLADIFAEHQL